jgi:prepilin-type N-terminal cleavage/methylation domain-containing protein
MKLQIPSSCLSRGGSPKRNRGFTLPEILIALTIFVLLVAGIISANLFGLSMFQVNQTKLNATDWSRRTFGKITDEIRSCNSVLVGNVTTNDEFVGLLDGEPQEGSAILIYPTTNTSSYITYFVKSSDDTFRRAEYSPNGTNIFTLADSVTNVIIFTAESLNLNNGNFQELTNGGNNRVIHLTLDIYQPESYGQSAYYYQLKTSATRRVLE